MEEEEDVVIVGAGIAGLATAVALKRVGVRALVLERSEGLRATGAALSLSPNAWIALDALGISHKLTTIYAPRKDGSITNVDTGAIQKVIYPKSDKSGHRLRVVHRKALLEALAEELPIETIHFSSKINSIETQAQEEGSPLAIIHKEDGTIIKAKALIGCDGVHSMVANKLGLIAPVNSGRWAVRGLAIFPNGHGLNHEVQQFLTSGKRAGFAPLDDKEVYWFLVCKFSSKGDQDMMKDPERIQREVMNNLAKDFPSSYLMIVQHSDLSTLTWAPLVFRFPWDLIFGNLSKGNITVAGDAMHPMTPDLGQGGGAALEDAVVLGRHIGELIIRRKTLVSGEVGGALEIYVKERRWRAAGLITSSYLSGWVQQSGSGFVMKFLRDVVFYRLLYSRIFDADYDCGKLPCVSSHTDFDKNSKTD